MKKLILALSILFYSTFAFAEYRIINGSQVPTNSDKWSWIVSIQYNEEHGCGGSIIAPQWILTAAHCIKSDGVLVDPSIMSVVAGNYNNTMGTPIGVEQIIPHPAYTPENFNNDLALLKLKQPITGITPVSVDTSNALTPGTQAWVAGWGNISTTEEVYPTNLLEVMLPVVDFNSCNSSYGTLTNNMLCAGFFDGSADSCQGDSGGPLISSVNGTWTQIGVVSFGRNCAEVGFPGVYTKIQNYTAWIAGYVGNPSNGSSTVFGAQTLQGENLSTAGIFAPYDFENVDPAFDWVFVTPNDDVYQLQGTQPTNESVFGWKPVNVIPETASWLMLYLGDWDQDGDTRFDWVLVQPKHNGAVYKLAGVSEEGTFLYSDPINIGYTISDDLLNVTFQ